MSAAVHSPPHRSSSSRKKSLKKLTVTTDSNGEILPTMEKGSPNSGQGRSLSRPSSSKDMLKSATRARASSASSSSSSSSSSKSSSQSSSSSSSSSSTASAEIVNMASPSTPSRSTDRKHVDNAIITKLQKLGMQDQSRAASGAKTPKAYIPTRERLAVVLDMDECMLHTTSFSEGDTQRYRQEEDRPTLGKQGKNAPQTVTFKMFDGCRGTANLRPHLKWFLEKCTAAFDTYVFTAGTEAYASPLLDLIDPERKLKGRFYRTSCRRVVCELGELYLKDLSSLPIPQPLSRMVLVDNNPVSFLVQPCNGIPVVSWYDNIHDVVLKEVFDILKDIASLDDVRSKLDDMFGLKVELRALRRTVGLKNAFEPSSASNSGSAGLKGKKSSLPPVKDQAAW